MTSSKRIVQANEILEILQVAHQQCPEYEGILPLIQEFQGLLEPTAECSSWKAFARAYFNMVTLTTQILEEDNDESGLASLMSQLSI